MSPFAAALVREEPFLARVIDRPMPSDPLSGSRVYLGPTAVSFAGIGTLDQRALPSELAHLKHWKDADLDRYYRGQV